MSKQYLIVRNGEQAGPYTLEQIQQMQADGQLLPSDMAWTEGQTDWQPLSQITGGAGSPDPFPAQSTSKSRRSPVVWIVRATLLLLLGILIVLFIFDYRAKGQRQEAFETLNEMGAQIDLEKVREITGRDPSNVNATGSTTMVTYSWRGGLRKHLLIIHYDFYDEKSGVGYINELEAR